MNSASTEADQAEEDFFIPEISDEELARRTAQIAPLISCSGQLYHMQDVDPRLKGYNVDPRLQEEAHDLSEICEIQTLHAYGNHGIFDPSIAEVVAQIPEEHLENVNAFYMSKRPKTQAEFNEAMEAFKDGFHVATVKLYSF